MAALKWFAWGYYGLAVVGVIMAIVEDTPLPLVAVVALCLGGVLLQALDLGLQLLRNIRDALVVQAPVAANGTSQDFDSVEGVPSRPIRSLAEVEADLKRLKV